MRSALLLAVLTTTLAFGSHTAAAAGRRHAGAPSKHPSAGVPNKQAAIGAYGRAVYPKYYWGLHAREFQNVGTPHGDQGIRGNTFQWQPW